MTSALPNPLVSDPQVQRNFDAVQGRFPLTNEDFSDGSVDARVIATDGVGSSEIAANSVGASEIGTLPAARVYYAGTTQTVADSTDLAILFDSERFDTDSIHDNTTNTSRLTCNTAGLYLITGCAELQANATGNRLLSIKLNNSTVIAQERESQGASAIANLNVSTIYKLAVTDYVELIVRQTSTATLNVNNATSYAPEFAMTFLHDG